jgi:hypothetical protein
MASRSTPLEDDGLNVRRIGNANGREDVRPERTMVNELIVCICTTVQRLAAEGCCRA